jgi:hypothetical protein
MSRSRSFRPQLEVLEGRLLLSTFYVATTGSNSNPGTLSQPFATIQHGLDMAINPGDTVEVRAGTYHERLTCGHSGTAAGGFITLEAYPGEHVLLSGQNANNNDVGYGDNMVQIINQSYVKVIGFEIAFNNGAAVQDDAFGVRIQGSGSNIEIRNNIVHDITGSVSAGRAGAGIHVYGSSQTTPYDHVIFDSNQIYNCQPGDSQTETMTVNGNVTNFQITNNIIHNNNNIGIDMIGGEFQVFGLHQPTLGLPVARNGVCSNNTVYECEANYGGGFAGGIYVDGGQNITVSNNISYLNDMGLEVGAENHVVVNGVNHPYVASGIVVENNLIYSNDKAGLVFGGFASNVGRVEQCSFINNTVYKNDTFNQGNGQLWIQWASNNTVTNNIFYATSNNVLIGSFDPNSNVNNTLDHNLYFAPGGAANAQFNWNGKSYGSYKSYLNGTGEDAHSLFANPLFVNAGAADFHLSVGSPATDAGSTAAGQFSATDFAGTTRGTPPDIGAYENTSASAPRAAAATTGTSDSGQAGAAAREVVYAKTATGNGWMLHDEVVQDNVDWGWLIDHARQ